RRAHPTRHSLLPYTTLFRSSSEIATLETRGRGDNYSGWNSPEADRLVQAYEAALDRTERNQRIVELLKLISDEVPMLGLYNNLADRKSTRLNSSHQIISYAV